MAGSIAPYNPYSGGIPASVANATPCGSTMTAATSPAIKSSRNVSRLTRWRHARNGNAFSASGDIGKEGALGSALSARRSDLAFPRNDDALDVAHQEIEQVGHDTDDDDSHDDDIGAQEVRRVQHHLAEADRGGNHFGRDECGPAESDGDPHARHDFGHRGGNHDVPDHL